MRGFNLSNIEEVLRYSNERYYDATTDRLIVVGKDANILIVIPHEMNAHTITPITIHATNRQQINYRIKSGRYQNE